MSNPKVINSAFIKIILVKHSTVQCRNDIARRSQRVLHAMRLQFIIQHCTIRLMTNGFLMLNLLKYFVVLTDTQIALAFGLIVATMVWCLAHVSGGHINPAVTFGFLVTRRISLVRAVVYVLSQMLGAVLGAGLLAGRSNSF